jgi:hypothetical protein
MGCSRIEGWTLGIRRTNQERCCTCYGECCWSDSLQGSRDPCARCTWGYNWYIFHATVRTAAPRWWIEGLDEKWLHSCIMNENLPGCRFPVFPDESAVDITLSINEHSPVLLYDIYTYIYDMENRDDIRSSFNNRNQIMQQEIRERTNGPLYFDTKRTI